MRVSVILSIFWKGEFPCSFFFSFNLLFHYVHFFFFGLVLPSFERRNGLRLMDCSRQYNSSMIGSRYFRQVIAEKGRIIFQLLIYVDSEA